MTSFFFTSSKIVNSDLGSGVGGCGREYGRIKADRKKTLKFSFKFKRK